ncbi:TonB-dependent hemoglobin/transferrin/lactoferrin family receptor [Hydrogenophaga sp.]|uniref:TonB-dependent hemoglobin/transferrin/lactoferrin family receptor n=1 Tax=Hydrogenophaga sp. TaxID=1904254 RepID=UPI0025C02C95|nr:TonB-dependent hemoglobin/transferrin/lactoferrin family receptor [Hydrogenophaga sp.]MBT9463009.1 TonB-dependent hemoglobin/transferrin/lactoferrin family receptor [Hydrogenophaga sp.]
MTLTRFAVPRFAVPTSPFAFSPLAVACAVLMAGPAQAQSAPDAATTTVAQAGHASALREVVISGARSERVLDEVPAAIDVLDGEDLDPARVQNIRDLVQELPNVSVKRAPVRFGGVTGNVGRDGNAGFNIRGLEGNRVLLTIDGIRVPRELSSGVFGPAAFGRDYYDLGLISRVEILRGASSALYGSDGLAGMVAMFTTEPKDLLKPGQTLGGRVGLTYDGEDDTRRLGLTLAGVASDSLQWLGSVQVGRSEALDNQGRNFAPNNTRTAPNPQKDKNTSLMGKLVFTPGGGQRHVFTAEHVDKSSDVEAYTGRAPVVSAPAHVGDLDGTSDMTRTRVSWDGRFPVVSAWADDIRAMVGLQSSESQETTHEFRPLQPAATRNRVRDVTYSERIVQAVLQAEKLRPLGGDWSQKLVYGVDLSRASLDNLVTGVNGPAYESYPLQRFPETIETTSALFVQSEYASGRWSVIPALRYDRVSLDARTSPLYPLQPASLSSDAVTPKLGVIFRGSDQWSLFGNFAAGFKSPSPLQLNNYFQNPIGNYETIPNPNLRPEKSRTLELGTRGLVGGFDWEAVAFTGRYKDFIEDLVTVQTTPRIQFQSVNRQAVTLRGFELKGSARVTASTTLRAAYGQTTGTDTARGLPLNSVNPAKLVLGVDHRMGDWSVGASLAHSAKKAASDIDTTGAANQFASPAYTTLDLRASWQLSRATRLSAAVHNLTDRKYWEWTNVRGISANDIALDSYTAPGRSLSVALVTTF